MKLLVLGANGQIGYELARKGKQLGNCVSLTRKEVDFARQGAIEDVVYQYMPDTVINAVAYTGVDKAESEPQLARQINTIAVGELARACNEIGAWCVHYSTDYVFDGTAKKAYKEEHQVSPLGVYGHTKLAGEQVIVTNTKKFLIFRTSWVYSWRGMNFVNRMLGLSKSKEELNVVNDQHGCPTYAPDIAKATIEVISKLDGQIELSGIYNMTGSQATTWADFAKAIFLVAGKSTTVNPIPGSQYPTPAERPQYSILDNTKLNDVFGVALAGFGKSLDDCVGRLTIAR